MQVFSLFLLYAVCRFKKVNPTMKIILPTKYFLYIHRVCIFSLEFTNASLINVIITSPNTRRDPIPSTVYKFRVDLIRTRLKIFLSFRHFFAPPPFRLAVSRSSLDSLK